MCESACQCVCVCECVCECLCESVHVSESECVWSNIIYHCHLASLKFEEAPRDTVQMALSNKNKCLYLGLWSVFV